MTYDEALAERVRRLLPGTTEKRMFGGIGLMERGHLVAGISHDDRIVRVPPDEGPRWLKAPGAHPMRSGRGMRGWVKVSAPALREEATLKEWIRRSQALVRGLPPK